MDKGRRARTQGAFESSNAGVKADEVDEALGRLTKTEGANAGHWSRAPTVAKGRKVAPRIGREGPLVHHPNNQTLKTVRTARTRSRATSSVEQVSDDDLNQSRLHSRVALPDVEP